MNDRFIEEYCLYDYTSIEEEKINELRELGCKNIQVMSTKSYLEPKTELLDKLRTSRWEFECSPEALIRLSGFLTVYKSEKDDNKYIIFITEDTSQGKVQTKELKSDSLFQSLPEKDEADEKKITEIHELIVALRSELASRVCFNRPRKQKKLSFLEEIFGFYHLGFNLKDSAEHVIKLQHTMILGNGLNQNTPVYDEEVYKGHGICRVKNLIEKITSLQPLASPHLR